MRRADLMALYQWRINGKFISVTDGERTREGLEIKLEHLNNNPMASIPSAITPAASGGDNGKSQRASFAIMTSLFFMWGFMTVFNDILIPRFKEAFTLDYFHAMLVQFAFFGAYFTGSLIYFIISATTGDPIAKIGYKNGVVIGLLISATGSALFWPAANAVSYPMFLCALFSSGFGTHIAHRYTRRIINIDRRFTECTHGLTNLFKISIRKITGTDIPCINTRFH